MRGAYIVIENERAAMQGYPSPIHDCIEDTHANYNRCGRACATTRARKPFSGRCGKNAQVVRLSAVSSQFPGLMYVLALPIAAVTSGRLCLIPQACVDLKPCQAPTLVQVRGCDAGGGCIRPRRRGDRRHPQPGTHPSLKHCSTQGHRSGSDSVNAMI